MLYFFDTSALIKRYHLEIGSHTIIQISEETENQILIASVSLNEFTSALNRIKNRRAITETNFKTILEKFSADVAMERVGIVDIEKTHVTTSCKLILTYNLSPMDAIILAGCIGLREFDPIFVCADVRSGLLEAAQKCHLSTLNPLSP